MALDEALLQNLANLNAARGQVATPILRVYRWECATVSFGYFGQVAAVRSAFPGRVPVRRWTGGGAVAHGSERDWTYSLIVPREHPFIGRTTAESYRSIHAALACALTNMGMNGVSLANAIPLPTPRGLDAASSACFKQPVRADVFAHDQKIAGAAQRRTRRGLLHQGSVQGLNLSWNAASRAALTAAFAAALTEAVEAVCWWRGPLGQAAEFSETLSLATALVSSKYGSPAWLEKR